MNTVLFSSSAPDALSASGRAASRSSSTDSTPDNGSEFAGILAGQAIAPPQPDAPSAPASGASAGKASGSAQPDGKAPGRASDSATAQQVADEKATAQQAADKKATAQSAARADAAHDSRHAGADRIRILANDGAITADGSDDADAGLPERFRQVMDAVATVAARPDRAVRDAKQPDARVIVDVDGKGGTDHRSTQADTTLIGRITQNPQSAGPSQHADGQRSIQIDKLRVSRNASAPDTALTNNKDRSSLAVKDGKFLTGTASPASDTDALTTDMMARLHSEASHNRGGPSPAVTADPAITGAIAPAPAFSLHAGTLGGPDMPVTSAAINQPLFSHQWAPELGRQFTSIIRAGENGSHIAELRLDPPELGPLRVTINLNDSVIQAVFSSAHASVRHAVEQALPVLQQQLEQEGLSLGHASVGDDRPAQSDSGQSSAGMSGARTEPDATDMPAAGRQRATDALVDTFA